MPDEVMDEEEAEIRAKHPLFSALVDAFDAVDEPVDMYIAADDGYVAVIDAYGTNISQLEEELAKRFTLVGRKADE